MCLGTNAHFEPHLQQRLRELDAAATSSIVVAHSRTAAVNSASVSSRPRKAMPGQSERHLVIRLEDHSTEAAPSWPSKYTWL